MVDVTDRHEKIASVPGGGCKIKVGRPFKTWKENTLLGLLLAQPHKQLCIEGLGYLRVPGRSELLTVLFPIGELDTYKIVPLRPGGLIWMAWSHSDLL